MGKIGNILLVAAAVAVNVIPGAGQAVSGAIFGAASAVTGTVGLAASIAFTIGQLAPLALTIAGLSAVGGLFAPGAPQPQQASRQVRVPTPLRTYIKGRRRSYGAIVLFETSSAGRAVDVLAFNDGRAQAIPAIYLNDDKVTLTGNGGTVQPLGDERYTTAMVRVGYSYGAPTETAFAPVVSELPGIWSSSHRGDGVVCGYMIKNPVKSEDFIKVYPQGDNISLSLAIDSWPLYDPRLANQDWSDDTTWDGPFDNGVLILLWYLVVVRGEDYATRIAPVIAKWIMAANICDSARGLKAGGTEKLYRSWLMWDSSAKPAEIVSEILRTFDGWLGEDADGHLVVYAGKLYAPTIHVTSAQIVDYEIKNFVESEDRINQIVVQYISEPHDYNIVEATPWTDETDITERGIINATTFAPQVPSHAQAQYLARREMIRVNAIERGTVTTNYSGREIAGHRYIRLTITEAGATFFDGVAEIQSIERNPQTGGTIFAWAAVPDTLDQWIPALNEGDPAPLGDRVAQEPLDTPIIIAATADFSDIGESGGEEGGTVTGVRIDITANGPVRDDLTWYARWRVGAGAWSEKQYSDADPGPGVSLKTDYVPYGADVDVQVAYATGDGRTSPWSDTETVDTSP